MRWLFAALMLSAACGRVGYDAGGPFAAPEIIDELSWDFRDRDPALTADELLIYFGSDRPGGLGGTDLWRARRDSVDAAWDAPEPVTELNGADEDISPHLSADGLTIWYASRRQGVNNISILVATRASRDSEWDPPALAAPLIDTGGGEFSPTLYADDTRMLYASDREDGGDVWETRLAGDQWQAPVLRDDLNSPLADGAPAIYRRGLEVVFNRETETTSVLMVATRDGVDARWDEATLLGVSTGGRDSDAWVSEDGRSLYFDSDRDGTPDLFHTVRAGEP